MMKVNFINDIIFGFGGPNLCLLGNEDDFKTLAQLVLDLTDPGKPRSIELIKLLPFENEGIYKEIIFCSNPGAANLGALKDGKLIFELDSRYWERLFKFFVLMSWNKATYYLNADDSSLEDLKLVQECNFICSSQF